MTGILLLEGLSDAIVGIVIIYILASLILLRWVMIDAFTFQLNFIIWPVYGFYLYLLHYVLLSKGIISRPKWIHGISSGSLLKILTK
ncbi:hypothetical protein [Arcobacter sp. CECT 8985]|uniref:hypothetical protein n=1 Tax=Arcobacter sp. CECT 8985 TaxID=1935424 RepID=UPI00102770EE|nr:hypothetical protein [Arcobacter sp. CECT 8985]RXJ86395.1 hypothetical protein CRU93_08900 [Arcobacter sp. CECT 8985]